jgi:F0F1-type ATP synthase gamma subunit
LGEQAIRPRFMPLPADEELEPTVHRLRQLLVEQFTREALRDVWLVAPHFRSAMRQEVVARQLLPLALRRPSAASAVEDLVIEPSVGTVVHALAGLWIETVCVEVLRSARLAELAARAIQMESSRQELTRQSQRLRYACFKSLHERMDVIVRETCVVQHLAAARAGRR